MSGVAGVFAQTVDRIGQRDHQRCDGATVNQIVEHGPQLGELDEVRAIVDDQGRVG